MKFSGETWPKKDIFSFGDLGGMLSGVTGGGVEIREVSPGGRFSWAAIFCKNF